MCALRTIRFPVRGDSGDLQEGADLFAGGEWRNILDVAVIGNGSAGAEAAVIFLYFNEGESS